MIDLFWLPIIILAGYGSWNIGRNIGKFLHKRKLFPFTSGEGGRE